MGGKTGYPVSWYTNDKEEGNFMEIEATSADRNLLLEMKGELDHHGARNALRELELAIDAALPKKLVLDFSGGEVTASYQGLAFSVPQTAMPAKSILSSLILVVDDLAKQEHISGEKDGDYVSVEGELEGSPYLLRLSAGGELAGFEMDNMDTVLTFTDFQEGGVPVATPTETECVSSSETL